MPRPKRSNLNLHFWTAQSPCLTRLQGLWCRLMISSHQLEKMKSLASRRILKSFLRQSPRRCSPHASSRCSWALAPEGKGLCKWNKHNKQPLKEVYIKGHLRYHKPNRKKIPPPNCDNRMYYYDIGVKCEESICQTCKNPAVYARRKFR